MSRRLSLVALLAAAALLAPACLVSTPPGPLECAPRTETYAHRHVHAASHHVGPRHRHPGNYRHSHTRTVWSCSPVTPPTTSAPAAPSLTVVGTRVVNPYALEWTVDVADPDSSAGQLSMSWTFTSFTAPATLTPTGTPGRYTFTSTFGVYNSGNYTLVVTDQSGLTSTVVHAYTAPPLCDASVASGPATPSVC